MEEAKGVGDQIKSKLSIEESGSSGCSVESSDLNLKKVQRRGAPTAIRNRADLEKLFRLQRARGLRWFKNNYVFGAVNSNDQGSRSSYERRTLIWPRGYEFWLDPSSELHQRFKQCSKMRSFAAVSMSLGTDGVLKESGDETLIAGSVEQEAISFLQEKIKNGPAFTHEKTVQTEIYALEHLHQDEFEATDILVSIWKKGDQYDKELQSKHVEKHLAVIRQKSTGSTSSWCPKKLKLSAEHCASTDVEVDDLFRSDSKRNISEPSSGITWVAVRREGLIHVVTKNQDLDKGRIDPSFSCSSDKEIRLPFMGSIVHQIEDLSSELHQRFKQRSKMRSFAAVSVSLGTNGGVLKGSGDERQSVFLQEKIKNGPAFTHEETVQTAISALEHLHQEEFEATDILVDIWKKGDQYDKELQSKHVEKHSALRPPGTQRN